MSEIIRGDVWEQDAYSGYVVAGDFVFLNFCVGNVGQSIEEQCHGAFNDMERRLAQVNLTLDDVVKLDVLMSDVWNIPVLEKVIKERFKHGYPARKTIGTNFAYAGEPDGLQIQIDAIAYKGKKD